MIWAKFLTLFLAVGLLIFGTGSSRRPLPIKTERKLQSLSCAPPAFYGQNRRASYSPRFPILPGWGNYHFPISSSVDSARLYFDQGLSLYYSYHPNEALSSFEEAAKLDPNSAIAYWGQALSLGPYYNGYGYAMPDEVPSVLSAMNAKILGATEKEKDLLAAMKLRYNSEGDSGQRIKLNRSYAEAMRSLVNKYPNDPDIKALYIDAVMLEHPWDFWFNDGNPKGWTSELITICEEILKENPRHPGAMHYYIHLTEASRHPEVALEDANQLKDLMPGVAHMVHMSSHVYERTGHYFQGMEVNDVANMNERLYDSLENGSSSDEGNLHYLAVQAFCAINGGILREGMPMVFKCRAVASPSVGNMYSQYLYMLPILAWVRMGQWGEILKSPKPISGWTYAQILDDFAEGIAWTRLNKLDSAKKCLQNMEPLMHDIDLTERRRQFNNTLQPATIARNILAAELYAGRGRKDSANFYYESAIRSEDSLIYFEPKDWIIPARQFYGASLLKWNEPLHAEKVYKEDLVWNPGNGWSLFGLYQCALAQQKIKQAETYRQQYLLAFKHSDIKPKGSVF